MCKQVFSPETQAKPANLVKPAAYVVNSSSNSEFKILFLNIQSMRNKINEIECFLVDKGSSIPLLCFSEHWLTDNECEGASLENYNLMSSFACGEAGYGGSAIFAHHTISCKDLMHLKKTSLSNICELAAVNLPELQLIISVYRPPTGDFGIFVDVLNNVLNLLHMSKNIVTDDFNVIFNSTNSRRNMLNYLLSSFGLQPFVNFNTRAHNCLDNVYTNIKVNVCYVNKADWACLIM